MVDPSQFVSRGGLKLAAALDGFELSADGADCADLGASTGGFTDCLLQRGATRVYAIDTAYGELAWKLRQDDRVTVLERTNALHADPGDAAHACDLVTIDLGWTRQARAIPAALRWLKPDPDARIVSLLKPHYEQKNAGPGRHVLDADRARAITDEVLKTLPALGVTVLDTMPSPIAGGKGGNTEYLVLLRATRSASDGDRRVPHFDPKGKV